MSVHHEIADHLSHSADNYPFELSIKNEGLKLEDAQSCEDLCRRIQEEKCIKVLRLEGNTLGVEAALYIGKALKGHKELERLILNDIFTGRLKTEIPKALENLFSEISNSGVNLVEINLSDNAFGPIGMNSLMSILKSPCCQNLQELRLHNNGLGIQGAKRLADVLTHMASGSRKLQLKTFICGRNRLENEGASAIASALQKASDLEEIQMPQNGIRAEGAISIFSALENHTNIRLINFNDNTISDTGSLYIAKVLPNLVNLEELNIGDCLLQDHGAFEIAAAIAGLGKLKTLNLSANEIEDDAGITLLDSLKACASLTYVNLDNNNFNKEVRRQILHELNALDVDVSLRNDEDDDEDEDEDEEEEEEGEYTGEDDSDEDDIEQTFDYMKITDAPKPNASPLFPLQTKQETPIFGLNSKPLFLFGAKNQEASSSTPTVTPSPGFPLFPMISQTNPGMSSTQTTNASKPPKVVQHIEPLFNTEGKFILSEKGKKPVTEGPAESKPIKHVRRKLSTAKSSPDVTNSSFGGASDANLSKSPATKCDFSQTRPLKNARFYFEMIVMRQRALDPSNVSVFISGMLSIACLFKQPELSSSHFHSFLDETIWRLDPKNQMAAANNVVYIIERTKSPELQQKQIELIEKFVLNHARWSEQARIIMKNAIQRTLGKDASMRQSR